MQEKFVKGGVRRKKKINIYIRKKREED